MIEKIILEIRSAEGGLDSKLFVETLYKMYKTFCAKMKFDIKEIYQSNNTKGISEIRVKIIGDKAYN